MPDPRDTSEMDALCFRCAKDLARRMLEKRFVSAAGAPDLVRHLGRAARGLCRGREPLGYPALRHASDITGALIERGRISGRDGAVASLGSLLEAMDGIARGLPPGRARPVMAASCELVLKMFETVTLSAQAVPATLESLASAFLDVLEGR